MGSGIPQPIFGPVATMFLIFFGLALLVGIAIYMQWFAPCSWWAGSPITDVPSRCLRELR